MFGECILNVRNKKPLVHCITNYVTVNDVANILLACGGSPVMADEESEVKEITALSSALYINIGTLNKRTIQSMKLAAEQANALNIPVILDPVGAGASAIRTDTAKELINNYKISVIRGNISEIKAIFKGTGATKGVDADISDKVTTDNLSEAMDFLKNCSKKISGVVAATGEIDIVADKNTCYVIKNGVKEMGDITGTGCQLGGLVAAFAGANRDNLLAAVSESVCLMGLAGEIGKMNLLPCEGNSTYRNRIIDAVYNMDKNILVKGAKYEIF